MELAYSWGETPERIALLTAINELSQGVRTFDNVTFTHEQVAVAAGREIDRELRQDLAYLRAMRLVEGEHEGSDDRFAVPQTVKITLEGKQEAERRPFRVQPVVVEITRALRPADGLWWLGTANYPHAEVEAMDDDQRERLAEIYRTLELLVFPTQEEVERQLLNLQVLFSEVNVECDDRRQTMVHWLSRVNDDGTPKTRYIRTLERAEIDPRILGTDSDPEHADAPGSA